MFFVQFLQIQNILYFNKNDNSDSGTLIYAITIDFI